MLVCCIIPFFVFLSLCTSHVHQGYKASCLLSLHAPMRPKVSRGRVGTRVHSSRSGAVNIRKPASVSRLRRVRQLPGWSPSPTRQPPRAKLTSRVSHNQEMDHLCLKRTQEHTAKDAQASAASTVRCACVREPDSEKSCFPECGVYHIHNLTLLCPSLSLSHYFVLTPRCLRNEDAPYKHRLRAQQRYERMVCSSSGITHDDDDTNSYTSDIRCGFPRVQIFHLTILYL